VGAGGSALRFRAVSIDYTGRAATADGNAVESGVKVRARTAVARSLIGVDAIRERRPRLRSSGDSETVSGAYPNAIMVVVAHWREPTEQGPDAPESDRIGYLSRCIESVLSLEVGQVITAVLTNAPDGTAEDLAPYLQATSNPVPVETLRDMSAFKPPFRGRRHVFSIGWKPGVAIRRHGFFLTWGHKALFRRALADPNISLLLYLEDDLRFTQESLSYWCTFREPLSRVGFIPGYVRYELKDGERYLIDQVRQQDPTRLSVQLPRSIDEEAAEMRVVGLANPYQAMYILDRPLARRHFLYSPFRDPLRSGVTGTWPIRERAATGPTFDDVPAGFPSRNVVPVYGSANDGFRLEPTCLIEHLPNTYTSGAESPFGRIRVEDLFSADPHPVHVDPRWEALLRGRSF
jgi:hypothetical protein